MSKCAAATLNDDTPTAKRIRIDEGIQIAPLADERAWRILEEFLTTDMTYPQMEETFLSYLDALFSGDRDDKAALDNLCIVKAKHILPASRAHKSPTMDRRLSLSPVQPSCRPLKQPKLKNPYLDLDAKDDDEEEEEEGNNNNGPSESCKVMHLPGSSSAARFAAVIDHLANKFEDTQNNSSQNQQQSLPSSISGLITSASAQSQDGRMYLLHVQCNVTDYIAQHLRKENFCVVVSAWLAGQLYIVVDSPKTIAESLCSSLYLAIKQCLYFG
ncbi:uncharacterized protein HD556DRAFT_1308521 [Suillus plorans]|uniref:Uncharacterized protein n=1 Tax=Suillus plorans TaxID=116603 RepID=A0A9P7DI58_9AGAM|nr:uncharacterized protein HD556DRAFT_1308521 [Suillus plorans]KAG1793682.1 hypothetical protein HD556DRAFT_1308521 [Suillus plorans]